LYFFRPSAITCFVSRHHKTPELRPEASPVRPRRPFPLNPAGCVLENCT
jgi:hypothetical protein